LLRHKEPPLLWFNFAFERILFTLSQNGKKRRWEIAADGRAIQLKS
jgi:hypothetical protein